MKTIKIMYKKVGEKPKILEIENTLEAKQKLVDGYIEVVPFIEETLIICDEEGKIKNKLPNLNIGYDYIAGDYIIIGDDYENGDFKSLTNKQIDKVYIYLQENSINY